MSEYDKYEFLGVLFTDDEAKRLLSAAGYTGFKLEWGRGTSGFEELKLCCNHPNGQRMFAEYAWKKERDAMVKRLLLQGLEDRGSLPEGS